MSASGVRVRVRGMSCASCAAGLERALARVPGVRRAEVSYAAGLATIETDDGGGGASERAIADRIRELGYEPASVDSVAKEPVAATELAVRLSIAAFFTMAAMLPSSVGLLGVEAAGSPEIARRVGLASAALSLPAVMVGGAPLARGALRSLRAGTAGMDFLISLGAIVAFAYSIVVLARGGHEVFFDTSAAIVTFALLGRVLEARARRRGIGALRALDALVPRRVHVVDTATREERDVDVESVRTGDLVRVRAGERVPVDGIVREGGSLADAAMLTGEWAPRAVASGDTIAAGLLLHDGTVLVEVVRGAGRRQVDRIRRAVDDLLSSRSPTQRIADVLSARLAWIVLACALATLAVVAVRSGAGLGAPEPWMRAVAVVVVACPCALGLATPMAIAVAAGRAASRGILFRDAESIEIAARIDRVVFDKTGTLTRGEPRVTSVITAPDVDRDEALSIASLLETSVEHPIARAIRGHARASDRRVEITVVPGSGVLGRADSTWLLGSRRFLESHGVSVPRRDDATTVHLARDGRWSSTFVLEDDLRPGAALAVSQLARDGLRPALVTGDAHAPAARVACATGIDEVHAAATPLEKAAIVSSARRDGARVAFVGDGLNDAPALAAADLGVAVSGATDLAAECARVVLVEPGIARVREAFEIARAARRRMRRNLAWAIGYNVLAIPLAASGRLSPALAAAAMAASSLSVVLSSLREGSRERSSRTASNVRCPTRRPVGSGS